jgi:uncharacterized protein YjbJ (UPF0337 family)
VKWDRLEEQWKQQRGRAVYHWSKTKTDKLAGRLQGRYRIAKEEAKSEVDEDAIHVSTTMGLRYGSLLH